MELQIEELRDEQKLIAETIGMEAYFKLTKMFGGTTVYIAKAEEILRRRSRDEQIREEFDGSNYAQLALKYGLTETWIRNIVYEKAVEIKKKPIDGQMNIADFLTENK